MNLFLIALGGALGSVARYAVASSTGRWLGVAFPYGTLAVNIMGSFAMGAFVGLLAKLLPEHQHTWRLFLGVGVLGGFTTFSAFSLDAATLIEGQQWGAAALYILFSVILSIAGLFLGLWMIRALPA